MKYEIIVEGHEGVFSCEEDRLGIINADNEHDAMVDYCKKDNRVIWNYGWRCFLMSGTVSKVFARLLEENNGSKT